MKEENPKIMAILRQRPAKEFKSYIEKALMQQWTDVIYSAHFDMLYTKYAPFVARKANKSGGFGKAEDETAMAIDDLFGVNIDDSKPLIPIKTIRHDVNLALASVLTELKNYKSVAKKYKGYLMTVANKGGQEIMDLIKDVSLELKLTRIGHVANIKFRLSHGAYKNVIQKRVNMFFKDLNKTTKKRLERALTQGLGQGLGKEALRDNLLQLGGKISKYRAEMIVQTETVATFNYMNMETAMMNGMTLKTWHAVGPRPCEVCRGLDNMTVKIDALFPGGWVHPPAHPNCQCEMTYDAKASAGMLVKVYTPYRSTKLAFKEYRGLNPFAVWAGGESLVGVDKEIGLFYRRLKRAKKEDTKDRIFTEAKAKLTDIGYNQLKLRLQS